MASSVIGALRVNLGLDAAQFSRGARQAEATAQRLGRSMQRIGAAISVVGTGLALAMRSQINSADDMGKVAQRIGIPVEALSQLRYAADLSAVSVASLDAGIQRLSREAAAGSTRFQAMGIAARDSSGQMRPTIDILSDMADLFHSMPDGAEKTALAVELLGRSGADLIPLLNGGSAALRGMMQEADQLGRTISQDTADAAARFNDALTRLKTAVTGLATQITAALIPVMADMTEWFSNLAAGWARLSPEMQAFAAALAAFTIAAGPALVAMGAIVRSLGLIRVAVVALSGPWGVLASLIVAAAGYFLLFRDNAEPARTAAQETQAAMDALNTAMGTFYTSASPQTARGAIEAANGLRQQAAAARDAAQSQLALLEAEAARFAAAPIEERGLLGDLEDRRRQNDILAGQVELERARAALIEANLAADRAVRSVTGAMSEQMTAANTLAASTQTLAVSLEVVGASAGGAGGALEVLEQLNKAAEQTDVTLHSVGQSLAGVFADAATQSRSLIDGLRDLARQLTNTLLNRAFSQIFGNIFPTLNLAGARAMGGPVMGGRSYLVGERGPEIYTPGASGGITPNHAFGGGSQVVNIINNTGQPVEERRSTGPDGQQILDIEIGRSIGHGRQDGVMRRFGMRAGRVKR